MTGVARKSGLNIAGDTKEPKWRPLAQFLLNELNKAGVEAFRLLTGSV
jgi:hypothetical protein